MHNRDSRDGGALNSLLSLLSLLSLASLFPEEVVISGIEPELLPLVAVEAHLGQSGRGIGACGGAEGELGGDLHRHPAPPGLLVHGEAEAAAEALVELLGAETLQIRAPVDVMGSAVRGGDVEDAGADGAVLISYSKDEHRQIL